MDRRWPRVDASGRWPDRSRFRTRINEDLLGTLLLAGLGTALSGIHLEHVVSHETFSPVVLLVGVIPLVVSLAVVAAALGLRTAAPRIPPGRVWWWAYGGAATMGAVASLVVFDQGIAVESVYETRYVLATVAAGGALGGTLVGIYDAQRVRRSRRIETIRGQSI